MPSIQIESTPLCLYTSHDSGIHEFKYLQPTREGWDACIALMNQVSRQTPSTGTVRFLIDAQAGSVPLSYAAHKAREWVKNNPDIPYTHTAVLYVDNLLLRVAEAMSRSLYSARTSTRFFHISKRDEALEWLLSR